MANGTPDEDARRSLVLGTAGHIDHGKTSLVRALTGHDLDRLPEEKARGITIELGFAPLDLGDELRVALVDVPGHEKFVRTMVGGASGLDLVMLVVAADEGVMPQTREHLAICDLLGVDRGLVVLTKSDLVDEEMLELATEDVRDALGDGPLASAPILAASAETGDGIDRVRETLIELVRATPEREDDRRPARLFVDRSFTKHGFGAVVTGTWSGRPLSVGDEVVLEPGDRRARIRGLERHGDKVDETRAGARIAVNLQGLSTDEVGRGDLLTEPDRLEPTSTFDARLRWFGASALEDAASVELLSGTTERRARLALIGDAPLSSGERGLVRVHVDGDGLTLLPGDRFVVRGFARDAGVGATLGGGHVLDVAPPHRRRRDPGLIAELESLDDALRERDAAEGVRLRIARAGLAGAGSPALARETGLDPRGLEDALARLADDDAIARLDGVTSLGEEPTRRLEAALAETLDAYHASTPLDDGMPRAALAGSLPENVPRVGGSALIDRLASRGEVEIRGERVAKTGYVPRLDASEEKIADALAKRYAEAGLEAPTFKTLSEQLGEDEGRLRDLARFLERRGVLVAAPDDLFFDRATLAELIERVVAHFGDHAELDTQDFKTMIGTSRRTAVPLMSLVDDLQVTRRDGSIRRLISAEPRWTR